jgi:F-type H+-transporting ATPase subunit a
VPDIYNMILASSNPLEHVVAKPLFFFHLFGYECIISNHFCMIVIATALMLVVLPRSAKGTGLVRKGFGNLIESVCVFVREEIARPFLGSNTDKHIGFIWTVFFFILVLNLLGMIPVSDMIRLITGKRSDFGGAATANIYVTGTVAVIAFFAIHVYGIREQGFVGYVKNFTPSVPWPILPFIFTLEVIAALVKPFALAVRLFANIFAGHVVIAAIVGLAVLFKSLPGTIGSVTAAVLISVLELFVAFLQAYIFTFLTTIFISFAVHPEH